MVKAGLYERAVQFNSSSITKSVNIIGHGGTPVISNHDLASWTLTSGYTNTYQTARSAVGNVGDFIKGQPGIRYEEKQSVAEVEVTPGSYFPGASTVYVHTADGRPADGNIYPFIAGGGPIRMTGAHTLYLENLTILGGQSTVDVRCDVGGSGPVLAMRNINAGYSTVSNVINVLGASLVIAQNCDAFHGKYDGFNYHMSQGVVPKVVELNCRGFKNGGSSTSDNGSTAHDGVKVIRVNGRYWANHGPNVADVNTATQSWNLNTDAYDSRLDDDWVAGVGAEMWLDNCVATRSYRSANAGGTIRLRGCRLDRTIGNIEAY